MDLLRGNYGFTLPFELALVQLFFTGSLTKYIVVLDDWISLSLIIVILAEFLDVPT